MGRYRDAIGELEKIDRMSMRENADLQTGKLLLALGNPKDARPILTPLLKSKDASIQKEATLQLISAALSLNQFDEATTLLKETSPANPVEESLIRYLSGRLQLAKGDRISAVGTFQALVNDPEIRKNLPSALYHESTVALADSLSLEGNESAAIDSLIETLNKNPDPPNLGAIFARLRIWASKTDSSAVILNVSKWAPPRPVFLENPSVKSSSSAQAITPTLPNAIPTIILPEMRSLHSLSFLASIQLQSDSIEKRREGRKRAAQLHLINPSGSEFVNRSLLELGVLNFKEDNFEQALSLFSLLDDEKAAPATKAYAKALAAKAAFAIQEKTRASQLFLEAEEIAREIQRNDLGSLAALNAGITLLTSTRSKEIDEITRNLDSPEARSFLILERGLFLSSKRDTGARDLLISFLTNFPDNPRTPEAALALAESAIFGLPFDRELARKNIISLKFDLKSEPDLEARRVLVLLALNEGIQQAQDFLAKAPSHPLAPRVLFQLGQTYRKPKGGRDKEIGKANYQFELLIEKYPASEFTNPARYYSALTSIALKTDSADKTAILRFRELIEKKGVLANESAINLCSLLIDRNQQERALGEIATFLKNENNSESDRRRFLVLGADASNQIGQHENALEFYKSLLELKNLPASSRNRAHYISGQAHEKLEENTQALESYFRVINRDFSPESTTSLEWKWYDKCGIEGALALLEREGRWKAAIQLAEQIGRSGSPRAEDARKIAERIGLEHFIYREREAPAEKTPQKQ
jgi:TolA-binding protein